MNDHFPTFSKIFFWIYKFKKYYLFSFFKIILVVVSILIVPVARSFMPEPFVPDHLIASLLLLFLYSLPTFFVYLLAPFIAIYISYRETLSFDFISFKPILVSTVIATVLTPFLVTIVWAIISLTWGGGAGHGGAIFYLILAPVVVFTVLLFTGWVGYYFARKKL